MPVVEVVIAALGIGVGGPRAWRKIRGLPEDEPPPASAPSSPRLSSPRGVYGPNSALGNEETHDVADIKRIHPFFSDAIALVSPRAIYRTESEAYDVDTTNPKQYSTESVPASPRLASTLKREAGVGECLTSSPSEPDPAHSNLRPSWWQQLLQPKQHLQPKQQQQQQQPSDWPARLGIASQPNQQQPPPSDWAARLGLASPAKGVAGSPLDSNSHNTAADRESGQSKVSLSWLQRALGVQDEGGGGGPGFEADKMRVGQAIRNLGADRLQAHSPNAEDDPKYWLEKVPVTPRSVLKKSNIGDSPMQSPRNTPGSRRSVRFDRKNLVHVQYIYHDPQELQARRERWALILESAEREAYEEYLAAGKHRTRLEDQAIPPAVSAPGSPLYTNTKENWLSVTTNQFSANNYEIGGSSEENACNWLSVRSPNGGHASATDDFTGGSKGQGGSNWGWRSWGQSSAVSGRSSPSHEHASNWEASPPRSRDVARSDMSTSARGSAASPSTENPANLAVMSRVPSRRDSPTGLPHGDFSPRGYDEQSGDTPSTSRRTGSSSDKSSDATLGVPEGCEGRGHSMSNTLLSLPKAASASDTKPPLVPKLNLRSVVPYS